MPEAPRLPALFELRDADAGDLPFLFTLYCDVRSAEVNAWGWPAAQRDVFLHMQFEVQRRSYQAAYPRLTHHIVCSAGDPIGRRLVGDTPDGICLVDIALLAAHRNRGIGSRLIQQLMDDCDATGATFSLHVLRGNPALHLYSRLGFCEMSADPMYIRMQRTPVSGRRAEAEPGRQRPDP